MMPVAGRQKDAALTTSAEDYLKAVYLLDQDQIAATVTGLAERLSVTPASASGMVRRLSAQKLIAHERYGGVTLTPVGRRKALATLRRHRIIESYLVEVLGYSWDNVHAEAERLEHAVSDELIDCMAQKIGEPSTDPHGSPIPTREGTVDSTVYPSLASLEPGDSCRVVRIRHDDSATLRYLDELELRPGVVVRVLECAPFGGPIRLEVSGTIKSIGPPLAAQVLVEVIAALGKSA